MDKVSQVPAIINKVGEAVSKVKPPLDPLNKIVQILSRIDKVLFEIGKVGVESFNNLNDVWATNHKGFSKMNEGAAKLERQIVKIGTASRKSGKDVEEGFLDKFNKLGVTIQGIKNIASAVSGFLSPIFEEGMARQNALSDFETLIGKEDAKDYADRLRKSNAAKLYGASTINENAKSMLAYGVDKTTVMQMQDVLGDIAMGDKNKMTSLATAFSQMTSLGKLQAQDWKQMVGAGFNPFTQMQKDLGKTAEELDTMMSKGQITADMVKDAFVNATKEGGQFFGSMVGTMENTLGGKIAVMKSNFDDLKAKLFELFAPIVEKLLPVITDQVIPAIMSMAELLAPVFDLIANNLDTVGMFVGVLGGLAAAMKIVNFVMSVNPISLVVIGIATLAAWIYKVIDAYDRWGAAVTWIMGPLGTLINMVMSIKRYWDDIVNAFSSDGIIAGLKRIGVCLLDTMLYPLQQILGWVADITGWEWAKDAQDAVNFFRDAMDAIEPGEENKSPMAEGATVVDGPFSVQETLEDAVKGGGGGGDPLATVTNQGAEAVASGGTRNTQITINLGNMVDTVNFNGTPSDNAQETVDTFTSQLLRVLYSAQTAV